ncbi:MAG TPA: GNAT family N-acetyltransferase [Candidatus Nanoarchaeia archaeon]|nr:GNAT family N-acetyltransferase [Candidatus Nanoarchaeia archaeon]
MITFKQYSEQTKDEWDLFAKIHPSTWIDSQSHWIDFFEKNFKYKNYSFMVYEDNALRGIMSLFLVKSIFFGRRLISGPIIDMGGPFLDHTEEKTLNDIVGYIDAIALKENVNFAELRCSPMHLPSFTAKDEYTDFYMDINIKTEDIWKNLDKKLRNGIRKAEKVIIVKKDSSYEALTKFYELYLITMRSLGSPPLSFDYFKEMFIDMKNKGFFLFAEYNGEIICAILILIFKDRAKYEAGAYMPRYRDLQANSLLVFKAIEEAKFKKCKEFIFGRTLKDDTVYRYKQRWGAKESPYTFYYKLYDKKNIPPDIRKSLIAPIATTIWGIMPLWISKRIGNYFRKIIAM